MKTLFVANLTAATTEEQVRSIFELRIPLKPIGDSERWRSGSERIDAGGFMVSEVIGMGQGAGSSSSRFSFVLGG